MASLESLLERFHRTLLRLGLLGGARGILIAASGGPDSTALCRLFAAARDSSREGLSLPPLWLGHVHHLLRGADADLDARFARDLAGALGLRHLETRVDVPALARERGLSPEAAARAARYGAFLAWTREHPLDVVALAHTADDQAETVLLRVFRGAGLRGLGGMPAERPLSRRQPGPFPRVARPLLDWRREEVLDLLRALGQPYREDATNRDLSILRNRVRHRLLPLLREEFEPGIDDALLHIASVARAASRDLEPQARVALAGAVVGRTAGTLALDAGALGRLSPTLRLLTLELASRDDVFAGGESPPSPRRLERVAARLDAPAARRRRIELGGGLRAEHRGTSLILTRERRAPAQPGPGEVALPVPGRAQWGRWELRAEVVHGAPDLPRSRRDGRTPDAGTPDPLAPWTEVVDRSTLAEPLVVRGRLPGDRFRPLGAPGSKKLKELFRERGVEPCRRADVPLVVDERGIVWVVGHRIADPRRLRAETREGVRLSAREA